MGGNFLFLRARCSTQTQPSRPITWGAHILGPGRPCKYLLFWGRLVGHVKWKFATWSCQLAGDDVDAIFGKTRETQIIEIRYILVWFWWIAMKFAKRACKRLSCNYWYSLGITHIIESICQLFCDFKSASRSYFKEEGDDLLPICFWRLPRRHVQTIASKCDFVDFCDSRWGGVEQMKTIAFSLGRCRKVQKSCSHAGCGSQKQMLPMQHGNAQTHFCDTIQFG